MTNEMIIKIVLIGECGVGKSNLLTRYTRDKFDENERPTVATEFFSKTTVHKGIEIMVQLWDTAGQERYRSLIPSFFTHCDGAILVYDVNDRSTFLRVSDWIDILGNKVSKESKLMIIGNKTDLNMNRKVSQQEGKDFASERNIYFWETSAKTNSDQNVNRAFDEIILQCAEQKLQSGIHNSLEKQLRGSRADILSLKADDVDSTKKSCC